MTRCRVARGVVSALAVAAIVASCGGSDSGGNDATPGSDATATESETSTESATVVTDASSSTDAVDETSDAADESSDSGGATPNCDAIFSTAEMEEFFAEPVELTEETNDSLGQLVCTWESIEDPDDTEDLAYKILVLQFYSGTPVGAAAFFDPSIFESVTTIEGIGDLAYTPDGLGPDFYFYDDPVGGSLSYTEMDMGDFEAPKLRTRDDVEQLFRTFHDRVT
jgi:hypothetical protein